MEIREVKTSELTQALDLIDEYDRPQSTRPSTSELESIHASIEQSGGCIVGAFDKGKLIGTCTINVCSNLSWSGRPYAMIENVIVTQESRRQGYGKALLEYSMTFARRANCYKLALMSGSKDPSTHQFYRSAGFSESKRGYVMRINERGGETL